MYKIFSSIQLSVILFSILIISSISGTLINQEKALAYIYHSWWYFLLLITLSINLILCTLKKRHYRIKSLGFLLTHFGVLIILLGGLLSNLLCEKGTLSLRVKQKSDVFYINKKPQKLGFTIGLDKFFIESYDNNKILNNLGRLLIRTKDKLKEQSFNVELNKEFSFLDGKYKAKITQFEPNLFFDIKAKKVRSKNKLPENPAIHVSIIYNGKNYNQWVFAKYHDLKMGKSNLDIDFVYFFQKHSTRIKDFKSDLSIYEENKLILQKTIEVNDPLEYKGYKFYQSNYDPKNMMWSGLRVVKDPGTIFVYLGFLILCLGILFIFYLKPFLRKD
ncbi:MAG: cytochrome c biogenesis protein ResB [Pseudomonadota bacterium]